MLDINWLDLIIIGLVVLSVLISLYRGFIKETVSLAAMLIGAWLAIFNNTTISELFQTIQTPMIRKIIGGSIIFISGLVLAAITNVLLGKLIKQSGLSIADRLVGIVFGVARGSILIGLLIMLVWPSTLKDEEWWQKSLLIPKFYPVSNQISKLVPDDFFEKVKEALL